MIEDTIKNYLDYHLSAPVYTSVPKDKPDEYFVMDKTGGGIDNKIRQANITVQSYARSKYKAAALIEEANAAMMDGLITLDEVSDVQMNGSYDYTDTTIKKPRYQSVFVVTHY